MQTLLIALGAGVAYLIAYHTYGRYLARKIFKLDPDAVTPSVEVNDDSDYVPTNRSIVFGHHFTSIAGTGPIVGPAIAVMWGWVPALIWILVGSIFMGAVHDFGALVVSMRNRGQTVGDIAGRVLNKRVRLLFLLILLFALWIVLAIFGWVIAKVFVAFPESILPVFLQIPIAIWIGVKVHRKGKNLLWPSVIALTLMYLTVWFGAGCPGLAWEGGHIGESIQWLNATLSHWPIWVWVAILLAYCYVASVIPVWVLLQPRDYINSLQLISSLGLVVVGLAVAGMIGVHGEPLKIVAPALETHPLNAPPIMPVLFVTIACGAISGFHCLVSSGTSSKQLKCETDAQFVGYGSMLLEGFLATLVLLAVAAGIGLGWPEMYKAQHGAELWTSIYGDWKNVTGGKAISAFVVGSANFLAAIGIDATMGKAMMGVLVASFAGTTLDTATRLQRYVVQELASTFAPKISPSARAAEAYEFDDNLEGADHTTGEAADHKPHALNPIVWLTNAHGATLFAVVSAFLLALIPAPNKDGVMEWTAQSIGTGGLILWPLFGATNQLLAGLAFLVICFWLWRRKMPIWFALPPMVMMLVMPAWAMTLNFIDWMNKGSYLLAGVAALTLLLEAWMIVEAILMWPRVKGVMEPALPPLRGARVQPAMAGAASNDRA
ncbi:MAG: carbon starvation protein A [Phycisphaera sp.]|nr:carbon starvation protein A [Phycisphaera sp.]